jgi:leucyl-tRNA synthetase
MEYNFRDIEKNWQQHWKNTNAYKVSNDFSKPKFYVLDMFPYPSGAGLHVGHPLGYIASDIYSRYKRLKGYNVLHPMGFDAFGLPAEQYAIEHGIHPAVSTATNIANFKKQLDNIGFCYDWNREVNTSEPRYYKWTQWIFLQLFKSFFNRNTNKTEPIENLVAAFEKEGNRNHSVPDAKFEIRNAKFEILQGKFSADQWRSFDEKTKQDILMEYRTAYCGYGEVNWCEALGTVLANDEVVNGVSERGGHPVVKKKLRQWYLRITEYADRLLQGLDTVDFSEAMKDMQSNWIGKSSGAEIDFKIQIGNPEETTEEAAITGNRLTPIELNTFSIKSILTQPLRVYTTRPDTIFGVDFMVVAPEHELVEQITTPEQKQAVEDYITYVKSRSERERMAEKKISGTFTGAYAVNPFDGREIPIWISEYVLAGYGTGAIMAVPCGDERDHKFAKHFNIPITNIIGEYYNGEEANPTKDAKLSNSDFLDGMVMRDAIEVVINKLEALAIGERKVNYKMRDAAFSRQRYWGEPFPIIWKDGIAYPLDENELPLELPKVESYSSGPEGEGPLANIPEWTNVSLSFGEGRGEVAMRETNTMPGYAGSSWYFFRYMDPHNNETFCDRKVSDYWNQVDLYIGGTEHAVGHLLYSRMWTKCLFDLGLIGHDEPYKRLVNQGMIQGSSRFVHRITLRADVKELFPDDKNVSEKMSSNKNLFISKGIFDQIKENKDAANMLLEQQLPNLGITNYEKLKAIEGIVSMFHVDVNIVDGYELDIESFKKWRNGEYADAVFVLEDGKYICSAEIEKMSKSKFNTVNPDDLVNKYGADTFRMYEMFLGPVEQSKPWDTEGIEGVHRFLRKLWRLFFDEVKGKVWNNDKATDAELKVLHKTIRKIEEDTERFSFNTAVAAFMVCVNELHDLKCHKKEVLQSLVVLLTPYAPHVAEELWNTLENEGSVLDAPFPTFEAKYVVESSKEYPVSINGKLRTTINMPLDAEHAEVEKTVMANEIVQKWLEGKPLKKFIFVKGKMVNVVV